MPWLFPLIWWMGHVLLVNASGLVTQSLWSNDQFWQSSHRLRISVFCATNGLKSKTQVTSIISSSTIGFDDFYFKILYVIPNTWRYFKFENVLQSYWKKQSEGHYIWLSIIVFRFCFFIICLTYFQII